MTNGIINVIIYTTKILERGRRMNQDTKNTAEFVFLSTSLQEMNKDIAAASATLEETKAKVDRIYEHLERLEKELSKMYEEHTKL